MTKEDMFGTRSKRVGGFCTAILSSGPPLPTNGAKCLGQHTVIMQVPFKNE